MAFAVMFALMSFVPVWAAIRSGHAFEWLQGIALLAALFGAIFLGVALTRVDVDEESLVYRPMPWSTTRVRFEDISASVPQVLAEPDHPVSLAIYTSDLDRPALLVRLKVFRREDVAWLLSLPGLRVQR